MKRFLITVVGSVQGVGFRPFIYRLAHTHKLVGSVQNTSLGVQIDAQGSSESLTQFQHEILSLRPERSNIISITCHEEALHSAHTFEIKNSKITQETELALLPDTAICHKCLEEFNDPTNRRYHYPFIHCTTCGPRFSLFTGMPFDRQNTTMIDFPMCDACQSEYDNPNDRRFYSQTTCCPTCGPKLNLRTNQQQEIATTTEAVDNTISFLKEGKIVALKNTGGYLLLADATNESVVERMRHLKKRAKKPFALLVPHLDYAKQIASITDEAATTLSSYASPIVLLPKTATQGISSQVAPESPYYGIMLPHNALQHLILNGIHRPLIATSGNISSSPICITEEEAFSELSNIADYFLVHNRRIFHRIDDSIVHMIRNQPTVLRRARGYIPYAITLPEPISTNEHMFATGGHLKNSFAFAKNNQVYLSQHIGDLDSCTSTSMYEQEVHSWEQLLSSTPSIGVTDLHTGYYTSTYLQNRPMTKHAIQHHKAHVWSGMLDNKLVSPLLAIAWDGSGYGEDTTVWGGEGFVVTDSNFERVASLSPFRLPGSEKAVREPRRSALGMIYAMNMPDLFNPWRQTTFPPEELKSIIEALQRKINAPLCSSMGRLFDGVSALLGCCFISTFEGEAALALENLARYGKETRHYSVPLINDLFDWHKMVEEMYRDILHGLPKEDIALAFHRALADAIVTLAKKHSQKKVLLTGGVMQNTVLLENTITKLQEAGFSPFWHHNIPPNDGGLAAGQLFGTISCA